MIEKMLTPILLNDALKFLILKKFLKLHRKTPVLKCFFDRVAGFSNFKEKHLFWNLFLMKLQA